MTEQNDSKEAMEVKEYEGKTAEDAIKTALADLNLPKENIKIQILTEGKRGLFGMQGAKKAKIRVTILAKSDTP